MKTEGGGHRVRGSTEHKAGKHLGQDASPGQGTHTHYGKQRITNSLKFIASNCRRKANSVGNGLTSNTKQICMT